MSRTYKIFYNAIKKYFSLKFKIRRFGTKQLQLSRLAFYQCIYFEKHPSCSLVGGFFCGWNYIPSFRPNRTLLCNVEDHVVKPIPRKRAVYHKKYTLNCPTQWVDFFYRHLIVGWQKHCLSRRYVLRRVAIVGRFGKRRRS